MSKYSITECETALDIIESTCVEDLFYHAPYGKLGNFQDLFIEDMIKNTSREKFDKDSICSMAKKWAAASLEEDSTVAGKSLKKFLNQSRNTKDSSFC